MRRNVGPIAGVSVGMGSNCRRRVTGSGRCGVALADVR